MSCGQLSTTFIEVVISLPNVSSSSFNIDRYEVTYMSVVKSFPSTVIHDVPHSDDPTNDTLTTATAGVTYLVEVLSRSGHLTSQAVQTTCTAGLFSIVNISERNQKPPYHSLMMKIVQRS